MKTINTPILLLLLAFNGLAWGGPDEGLAAVKVGDDAAALQELRQLAEEGDSEAQYNLGLMYDNGQGITQDYKEAAKWFRKSADENHPQALFYLGSMYRKGQGVTQDYKEAVKLLRLSARSGFPDAGYDLGIMYLKGDGVPQDYVQAHMWFNIAVVSGMEDGVIYRDYVARKMTAAQIAEAQKLAREWMDALPRQMNVSE